MTRVLCNNHAVRMLTLWCSEMCPKQGTIPCCPSHAAARGPALPSSRLSKEQALLRMLLASWTVALKEKYLTPLHKNSKKERIPGTAGNQEAPGVIPKAFRPMHFYSITETWNLIFQESWLQVSAFCAFFVLSFQYEFVKKYWKWPLTEIWSVPTYPFLLAYVFKALFFSVLNFILRWLK